MATIRERINADGSTVYHVQIRLKGHPAHTASFTRLTDARRWAVHTEADLRAERYFPGTAARRRTVAELIDRYERTVLPHKAPGSISVQRPQLRWWKDRIGHLRLSDVTPAVIAEQRDDLTQRFKPGSVRGYIAALSHAFTTAIREWQWMGANPISNIRRPRNSQARVRFLADEERVRLLDACKTSRNPYLYTVVVLALSTGARKMELLSLTWPDVDLRRGMITLHATKNRDRRALPLTGYALELMREHAKVRKITTDFVFPGREGPAAIDAAWASARAQSGIEDFRFHDLRHSCASYLAMNGASLAEIAEVLGHRTLEMVRRYTHLSEQHTTGVVARMNARIFGGG
jgi:integrase